MDVLNYAQQYSFNDCYGLLYNRYTECDSREDIPVESVSDSSHILINSLRYNVISSNLMKIRSLIVTLQNSDHHKNYTVHSCFKICTVVFSRVVYMSLYSGTYMLFI